MYGEEYTESGMHSGVREGCPLFPVLLNHAVGWSNRSVMMGYPGIQLSPSVYITDLAFADDIFVRNVYPAAM